MSGKSRLPLVVFAVLVAGSLFGASTASAVELNDALPGVPMGPLGASGVVDYALNANDVYAVELFAGIPVTFRVTRTDSTGDYQKFWQMELYAPNATALDSGSNCVACEYAQYKAAGGYRDLSYTPAVTGVYYFRMRSLGDIFSQPAYGLAYRIDVIGSVLAPGTATRLAVSAAPGYTLMPLAGQPTVLKGRLSPEFSPLVGMGGRTLNLQSSKNGTTWITVGTADSSPAGIAVKPVSVVDTTYYRWTFGGDGVYASCVSANVLVRPRVIARVSGLDRYEVAANLARKGWDSAGSRSWPGVTHLLLTNGENGKEADPLCAAGLAGAYASPVLLTRTLSLPLSTRAVITEIAARRKAEGRALFVHLVGGTGSVPDARWAEVASIPGVSPVKDRVAGADRYAVSANIAKRVVTLRGVAQIPGVILVAGDSPGGFYDALAVSPAAYGRAMPMLAVRRDSVPPGPAALLVTTLAGKPRYAASSPTYIAGSLAGATRLAISSDRYSAAVQIATACISRGWTSPGNTGVAAKIPDALTGGAFLGKRGGVLFYTDSASSTHYPTDAAISSRRYSTFTTWILGGTGSIPQAQESYLAQILN